MTATLITSAGTVVLIGASAAIAERLAQCSQRVASVRFGQVTFHLGGGAEVKIDVLEKNIC